MADFEEAKAFYQAVLELCKQQNYQEAIEQLNHALQLNPNFVHAYYLRGIARSDSGKKKEAIEDYTSAIKLNSQYARAYYLRGIAHFALGENKEAIIDYDQAINLNPKDALAYNSRGIARFALEDEEGAFKDYDQANNLDPKYAHAYYLRGNARSDLGDKKGAIKDYDQAINLNPKDELAYFNRGNARSNLGDKKGAIEDYTSAIDKNENWENTSGIYHGLLTAYLHRGNAYAAIGLKEEAINDYNQAIILNQDYAEAYFFWGILLSDTNESEQAIEKYSEAAKKNPQDPYSYHNIAEYFWKRGDYQTSWKEWQKARRVYEKKDLIKKAKDNRNADYFQYFGDVLNDFFGDFEVARSFYQDGLKINERHAGILTSLGNSYLEKSNAAIKAGDNQAHRDSRKFYQKAIKQLKSQLAELEKRQTDQIDCVKPEHLSTFNKYNQLTEARTLLSLAKITLKMQDYPEAKKYLQSALRKHEELTKIDTPLGNPASDYSIQLSDFELAEFYSDLGIVYIRTNDLKQGTKYFEQAHRIDPEDLNIWSNLAEAYLRLEQLEAAETEFRKILKITDYHVESQIGLAETYVAMGDKDSDFYSQAIKHFDRAIHMAKTRIFSTGTAHQIICSKRLTRTDLAAVYYSLGYTKVQLYERSQLSKETSLLNAAVRDFKKCLTYNPNSHKAARAIEKIQKTFSARGRARALGSTMLFCLSLLVFGLSQHGFWWNRLFPAPQAAQNTTALAPTKKNVPQTPPPQTKPTPAPRPTNNDKQKSETIHPTMDATQYTLVTFGSLTFMVVSLYLPQLLKLKIAGIELEKSAVDQIKISESLGISK